MEIRKFVVEIRPDGHVTCCEYEEPRDACKSAWLAGYRQAIVHCNEEVDIMKSFRDNSQFSEFMYQGAVQVSDVLTSCYHKYSN